MKHSRFYTILSICVLFVFVFSLLNPAIALADESTPPAGTEEPAQPAETEAVSETESAEGTEANSTPEPEAEVESESTEEPSTPAEVLESAPEGVDVVVLDENGEAMSLTTEQAADVIVNGDPMWCPDGVLPGGVGCTPAYTTFTALIADLADGGYSGSGTIYVSYDYNANLEGNILIDNLNGSVGALNNLVIQGGWNFGTNTQSGANSNLDDNALSIINWVGNVTVNNIFSSGATPDYLGAIFISTQGDIELNDVIVEDSTLYGLSLATSNGDVELNDVTVEDSAQNGLDVFALDGDVELNNVTANNNGLEIAPTIYSDQIYIFSGDGIFILAGGDVTLSNVIANNNGGDGASITSFDGNIEITNSVFQFNGEIGDFYTSYYAGNNEFITNYSTGDGLIASAYVGSITLLDVLVENNANNGASLYASEDVTITDSSFSGNGWSTGLFSGDACDPGPCGYDYMYDMLDQFCAANGDIDTLIFNPCGYYTGDYSQDYTDVFAPNFEYYVVASSTSNSEQEYYGQNQSGGTGLEINNLIGNVSLNGVTAFMNSAKGAEINVSIGNIDIQDSIFMDNGNLEYLSFAECIGAGDSDIETVCNVSGTGNIDLVTDGYIATHYREGLDAFTDIGNITLNNVEATGNGNDGASLGVYAGSIFITDSNFDYNGYPLEIGLPYGLFGEFLYDFTGLSSTLLLPTSDLEAAYTFVTGDNPFIRFEADLSSGSGLDIGDAGSVSLSNVVAQGNGGFGASITRADGNVTITDSQFNDNGYCLFGCLIPANIDLSAYGFIELDSGDGSIQAGGNTYSGLNVQADGNITLNNVYAVGNAFDGADLFSFGNINITGGEFSDNGDFGLNLYFYYDQVSGIILDGQEGGSGLFLDAPSGDIKLVDVVANSNSLNGVDAYSNGGRVIVSCGQYNDNGEYGVIELGASSLELYGPEILNNGNSPDEYMFSGALIVDPNCLVEEVVEKADCEISQNIFILPNSDYVVFPCKIKEYGVVYSLLEAQLPASLSDVTFVSALQADVYDKHHKATKKLPNQPALIAFHVPESVEKGSLTILHWDGDEWVDLGGELIEDGTYFTVSTTRLGSFVLASR